MISLTINGEQRTLEHPTPLLEFLERLNKNPRLVVVERNREIVPRSEYANVVLIEGDEIEIVQMMAGG